MAHINPTHSSVPTPPARWLVTGVAGFIGSHLLQRLLRDGHEVVGIDNFSTGKPANLQDVRESVGETAWRRFTFIEGDIRSKAVCGSACDGIDVVLHQAALGSVPRSLANPAESNDSNVSGTVQLLVAAKDARVRRIVFASSSSVYGDHPRLPKVEQEIGRCLSPYAVTKRVCELYADVFALSFGLEYIGLRYFNVFGPRQDPNGAYAAVIPKWIAAMLDGKQVSIYGDGETSRDFCYIENVIQANLLAATTKNPAAVNQVYNIAVNGSTTLNAVYRGLRDRITSLRPAIVHEEPVYRDFRPGDVRHSQADISKAQTLLGYNPEFTVQEGLDLTVDWFATRSRGAQVAVA